MALFQKSVLSTFPQDESKVALRWAAYQKFLAKVDAIKGFKEEEYQDGFFKDVFENGLGYTLKTTNPSNFNLEREKKNETDGKKADGVIYVNGEVIGVVELKDQKTKQLDLIEAQAFNYHNSHSNSKYVIISNFDELRFYIDKKTAYEKFNLFSLCYDEFKKLHLLLSYESINENIPQKLKDKSTNFEQNISKELYKDFTIFRTQLFENIIANNPDIDKSLLLRLTQKLCDRIIFILFAEDRALLRTNTIKEIREEFANQRFTDYSLYDIFKFYFEAINKGNAKLNIPKYNGGLFASDELLDSLNIDDVCLDANAQKLSNYDFVSDISVNILGHIFEQSLSDLEELNASINHMDFDKKNSKRKKDGVFYTPEYITRYIVENTLGKLCEEQKEALHVKSVEAPKNSKKPTKEEALIKENLERYKEWLLHVKILDPACGSGAFLNQALEYLIKEHKELQEKLTIMGDITAYYEIEASILENNLYGVDINEDAVEIARLSLWLRTAQKGRALANLSDKIKCGNSLIADKTIAQNAFVWEEEFPEVFANGGFDVVIGNPPYITFALGNKQEFQNQDIEYFKNQFPLSSAYKVSSYLIFIEKALTLLSNNGLLSFIVPNSLYTNYFYTNFRQFLIDNYAIYILFNLDYEVFSDVTAGGFSIFVLGKNCIETTSLRVAKNEQEFLEPFTFTANQNIFNSIPDKKFLFSNTLISLWNKSFENAISLDNENFQFYNGIKTGNNDKFLSTIKIDERYKPVIRGADFYKYTPLYNQFFVLFDPSQLWSNTNEKMFIVDEKLIIRRTSDHLVLTYDDSQNYILDTTHLLFTKTKKFSIKYILVLMLSKLMDLLYKTIVPRVGQAFAEVKIVNLKQLPIKEISKLEQEPFIEKADVMLELNRQLQSTKQAFLTELNLEKIPQKLQNFEALEFEEFVKEYTKAKKIKFADKLEERTFKQLWQSLFENDKTLTCKLKIQIQKTDKEIDAMVYELYGLSEDEIKIVEGT